MNDRQLAARIAQLRPLQQLSRCPRSQVAAMLIDPQRNVILADAYNGTPRGGPELCGGDVCLRDSMGIASGERSEIGCTHAEANLIGNAAHRGVSTAGSWALVTREPCGACAKVMQAAGIARVIVVDCEET